MINYSNKQYANIKTMNELRSVRERLSWQIEASEQSIERQVEGVREIFSLSYLSTIVMRKIESVRAWISTIYDGYRLAMSLFSRKDQPEAEPDNYGEQKPKSTYEQVETIKPEQVDVDQHKSEE